MPKIFAAIWVKVYAISLLQVEGRQELINLKAACAEWIKARLPA